MVNQKMDLQASLLAEKLNLRLGAGTVTKAYDTNGDVHLTVMNAADVAAIITFKTVASPASGLTDALGLTQRVYTPHVIGIGFDSDPGTNGLDGKATPVATKFAILGEVFRIGMRVDLYEKDAGGALALADIAAANFVASFESLEWGERASV